MPTHNTLEPLRDDPETKCLPRTHRSKTLVDSQNEETYSMFY